MFLCQSLITAAHILLLLLLLQSFYVGIGRTHSEHMLYIHAGSAVTSEMLFMPADTPEGTFKVVLPRTQDVEYR
jgi:oligopeptidase B